MFTSRQSQGSNGGPCSQKAEILPILPTTPSDILHSCTSENLEELAIFNNASFLCVIVITACLETLTTHKTKF